MSTKHRKACDLAANGADIRIIDEDEFICLLAGDIYSPGAPEQVPD